MNPIEEAEKAVLTELFRRFPKRFVWIGGSVLHLVHHSPRTSFDLDLAPVDDSLKAGDIIAAVHDAVEQANSLLRTSFAVVDSTAERGVLLRIRVVDGSATAFSIDVTRIAGTASSTRAVLLASILGSASVDLPADSALLFQKLRALLLRRYPKPGDLFDAWFLLNRGARLSNREQAVLHDEAEGVEIDELLSRFDLSGGGGWISALRRAGVEGLNQETAAGIARTVRDYLAQVLA